MRRDYQAGALHRRIDMDDAMRSEAFSVRLQKRRTGSCPRYVNCKTLSKFGVCIFWKTNAPIYRVAFPYDEPWTLMFAV